MISRSVHDEVLSRLNQLRLHQQNGRRSPHKPLLVLLALGRLATHGSSALPWAEAEQQLSALIAEFGPASRTGGAQSAAYPFTRLRADGVWVLDREVPMDRVGPLSADPVVGRLVPDLEQLLTNDRGLLISTARGLVESHFPATIGPDVLSAVGFDPAEVLDAAGTPSAARRRRNPAWRERILQAWDRQCAFCGYDGQVRGATVGLDAAHVRWWAFDGPDTPDNGLALCMLHHKLFDLGVLGLNESFRVVVSTTYTSRTQAGRAVYDLHGVPLRPRRGTPTPALAHVAWHRREVFKGEPLTA